MVVRKIKKYPNRRLYDTGASAYIKSKDLRAFLLAGERLSVIDVQTGRDITRSVLFSMLAEEAADEQAAPIFSEAMLSEALRFDDELLAGLAAQYLEKSLKLFIQHRDLFQAQMQNFDLEDPLSTIEKLAAAQDALLQESAAKIAAS